MCNLVGKAPATLCSVSPMVAGTQEVTPGACVQLSSVVALAGSQSPLFWARMLFLERTEEQKMASVAGGQSELSMATQIPAPGLLLTESGPGVYTGTLATECSPPPHGAFKWSQTHSCREPGHLPLSD